jgi:hypothetical protein
MAHIANANMTSVNFKPNMPLYIPRLFSEHADESYIAGTFFQQSLGQVDRVDLIAKEQDGQTFFEAFVHFAHWFDTPSAHALQAQVLDPQVKAQVVHCQREVRPGVWKPAFWIVNECLNPETPEQREIKHLERQLADEQALADFEESHLLRTVEDQARLIHQLFALVDHQAHELARYGHHDSVIESETPEHDWMDPDELRDTPEDESELPLTGQEIAQSLPDGPLSDFYKEAGEGLSEEWLALSDEEKLKRLDSELERLSAEVASAVLASTGSCGSSQSSTGVGQWCYDGMDPEEDEYEARGECLGCETGADCDGAHRRQSDGEYYSGCYCRDTMNPHASLPVGPDRDW